MTTFPIDAVGLASADNLAAAPRSVASSAGGSFVSQLMRGVEQVNQKVVDADALVRAFALDDSVPLHQVTYALEQARLSVELMMQVRGRLLEGYQEMLRMQL